MSQTYPHNPQIVLASKSQERKRLMKEAGFDFLAVGAQIDEKALRKANPGLSIRDMALFLAKEKALDVSTKYPHSWVIGSDQTLACQGQLFEKPETIEDVRRDIAFLQGKEHALYTAVVLVKAGKVVWEYLEENNLRLKKMTPEAQESYVQQKGAQVIGCLGCFQIEKSLDLFEKVEGPIDAIQGMPMAPLKAFFFSQKSAEQGRSLLEMLAVLAIAGVLSVGGLWGLKQAKQMGQGIHYASEITYTTKEMAVRDNWRHLPEQSTYTLDDVDALEIIVLSPASYALEIPPVSARVCQDLIGKLSDKYQIFVEDELFQGNLELCEKQALVSMRFLYHE